MSFPAHVEMPTVYNQELIGEAATHTPDAIRQGADPVGLEIATRNR
jgi:uncharacterized protein with HEPN domain